MTVLALPSGQSCPFSSSRSSSQCPFTAPSVKAAASRTRVPGPPRAPTGSPDLRRTPSADLLYLPPLLSLLPASVPPSIPPTPEAQVGYTTSRLPTVDAASIALHEALHAFRPTTPNYAYEDYPDAFIFTKSHCQSSWKGSGTSSRFVPPEQRILLLEISMRRIASLTKKQCRLWRGAQAGGLLAYWYGAPNLHGSNLATCIWMSRAHAVKATSGPKHVEAMRLASEMYANYDLERYVLRKVKGETGVTVEQWLGGEVSFGE